MYWTHLLGEEMLPRRSGGGTLTQVLLSGACCFCDNVLSREQFRRLLAVEVVNAAGLYLCVVASFMAVLGIVPNIFDQDVGKFIFLWALLLLPAWGWYKLIQHLHLYILRRRSTNSDTYSSVATADAVADQPAANSALELV